MEVQFKPFHETYRAIMYSLTFGMVYPNPATERWRLLAIPLLFLSILPLTLVALFEIHRYWCEGNYLDVIRHFAMFTPFLSGITKMCLLYVKRDKAKDILDMINKDYASFNNFPDCYKPLIKSYIRNTLVYHWVWIVCVILILSTFVLTTIVVNAYEYIFRSEPKRQMIYDMNIPFMEPGTQLETPYFEVMFIYMTYMALIYYINFTGYDGFMITSVNHVCLKVELFCQHVDEAMKYHGEELRRRMAFAIDGQCEIFKLIATCQSTFQDYLGLVYMVVTLELCVCLYLMTEGYKFDYKFTAFSIGTILHIYVPCRIADKLKNVCEEASTLIYCCGWENMHDLSVRRYIPYMIARAQFPVALKAFGIVTYEMDLFVRTMKTAYSLYTLIKT